MKMEQAESSETPTYKIQMPGITQKKEYKVLCVFTNCHPEN